MKLKNIILTLTLSGLSLLAIESFGQQSSETGEGERGIRDSLQSAAYKKEMIQAQKEQDADKMAEFKQARRETKAKAREAQRVEQEANDAARESKNALRTERKAQKARKNADRQANKAAKARDKSDQN